MKAPSASERGSNREPIWHRGSPPRRTVLPRYSRRTQSQRRTMADTTLTWLGHSTFRLDTASGKRIYIDPFLNGNPKCPEGEVTPERVDMIAITHGHGDHVGDAVDLAKKHEATVVAPVELADWLQSKQGLQNVLDPNKGGSVEVDGVTFTLTNAHHSSSNNDGE